MDGHPRQPGEPGPGGGDEQAGWRQGWGSQLGDLTGEWRTKIPPGFFKKVKFQTQKVIVDIFVHFGKILLFVDAQL